MAVNRTRCLVLFLEIAILVAMYVTMIVLRLTLPTFHRGFFCNDESLMYPYSESTVPYWSVLFVGFFINFCIILILIPGRIHRESVLQCTSDSIAYAFSVIWPNVLMLLYGFCVTYSITEVTKNLVGRLRPHFIPVCLPVYAGTCTPTLGYIQNFTCSSNAATEDQLLEMRKSFPSGHTSSAFYLATAFAILLQIWWRSRSFVVLKAFLQAVVFVVALYVGISRISDYKHHWSDVLAGAILGIVVAIVALFVFYRFIGRSDDEVNDNGIQARGINRKGEASPI